MTPERITVHCSASPKGKYLTAAEMRNFHMAPKPEGKGFRDIGYHFVVRLDGTVEKGRDIHTQGAHVKSFNADNVGICLIGGIGSNGKPDATYNDAQYNALYKLIHEICEDYEIPFDEVCGHRDFSADLNNDGVITSNEYIKECPCFDVRSWLSQRLVTDGWES